MESLEVAGWHHLILGFGFAGETGGINALVGLVFRMTGGRTPVRDIPGTFEVANVNEKIAPRLVGLQVTQQKEIDKLMVEVIDGAQNDSGMEQVHFGSQCHPCCLHGGVPCRCCFHADAAL